MKSKLIVSLLTATLLFTGCSSKGNIGSNNSVQATKSNKVSQASTDTVPRASTDYHFAPVKPGTVKPLSQSEKTKTNQQVGKAINNLNSALQSVQDVPDVDISAAQQ
ncbi:MAG: hypothetical protein Q8936_10755 [Bacillota bacterium]|nr:hypothetical protein [Bacillota bacterium]